MSLLDILRSQRDRELLSSDPAARFLHGALLCQDEGAWVRPSRFSETQLRMLQSCMAWHPGIFRTHARSTSGMCLRFRTDASEIAVSLRLDPESRDTVQRLAEIDGGVRRRPHDGMSVTVDGRHAGASLPVELESGLPGLPQLAGSEVFVASLVDPEDAPLDGMAPLPGFGRMHEVTVWLPNLRGCVLGDLWTDGFVVEPVEDRPTLLVMGDSSVQGFGADDPALSWPASLADLLGMDLVNQGIAGEVFQQGMASSSGIEPALVVLSYGLSYRAEPCGGARTASEVGAFMGEVCRAWPKTPAIVVTPFQTDPKKAPAHRASCFGDLAPILSRAAAPHPLTHVVDGHILHDAGPEASLPSGEPTVLGCEQVAERLLVSLELSRHTPEALRDEALRILSDAPDRAFYLQEGIRRGVCDVVFATEGCVLGRFSNGNQAIYAPDHALGLAVLRTLAEPTLVTVLEPDFAKDVMSLMGLDQVDPFHVARYRKGRPIRVAAKLARAIRPLDASFAQDVRRHYSHARFLTDEQIRQRLDDGLVLGAFEGDELVGFVGEHDEGSIGMLEVFPGHRDKGWGRALEATKINEFVARNEVPWLEVYPYSKTSLKLQRDLGLTVTPATDQCYVSRKA